MKSLILAITILLLPYSAKAASLDTEDKYLIGIGVGSILLDWGTTLDIENHPEQHETNSALGPHPSRGDINTYFARTLLINALLQYAVTVSADEHTAKGVRYAQAFTLAYKHGLAGWRNHFEFGLSINF